MCDILTREPLLILASENIHIRGLSTLFCEHGVLNSNVNVWSSMIVPVLAALDGERFGARAIGLSRTGRRVDRIGCFLAS